MNEISKEQLKRTSYDKSQLKDFPHEIRTPLATPEFEEAHERIFGKREIKHGTFIDVRATEECRATTEVR